MVLYCHLFVCNSGFIGNSEFLSTLNEIEGQLDSNISDIVPMTYEFSKGW